MTGKVIRELEAWRLSDGDNERRERIEAIRLTPRKLARSLNVDSVRQVQKYAFCLDGGHNRLLEKHLPPRDRP